MANCEESPMEVDDHESVQLLTLDELLNDDITSSKKRVAKSTVNVDLHADESLGSESADGIGKDDELDDDDKDDDGVVTVVHGEDDEGDESKTDFVDENVDEGEQELEHDFISHTENHEDSVDGIAEDPFGVDAESTNINSGQDDEDNDGDNSNSNLTKAKKGSDEGSAGTSKRTTIGVINADGDVILVKDTVEGNEREKDKNVDEDKAFEESQKEDASGGDINGLDNELEETDKIKTNLRERKKMGMKEKDDNTKDRDEPEEITLDDDDEGDEIKSTIRIRVNNIFDEEEEGEQIEASMDADFIQNMLQVDMGEDIEDEQADEAAEAPSKSSDVVSQSSSSDERVSLRTRPKRAAAAAAENTIREITVVEEDVEEISHVSKRPRRNDDRPFNINNPEASMSHSAQLSNRQRCHVCKKMAVCQIKIQQYGTDVYICSNACFNNMRYPSSKGKRRLPCCHCSITSHDGDSTYYWETMNFCSDLCVGNYQIKIGGLCATCNQPCPWLSMGKYCVRFGSDIRQFCTTTCLETYKKNARVCFHCQLDIKRLGNVILANIPSKNTPKEFCSQDCVEMYVEQNLNQTVKSKSANYPCVMCKSMRECYRELVLPSTSCALKTCSQSCWNKLVQVRMLNQCTKCESCAKYINLDFDVELPAQYVSTEEKLFGFCSATCKNVFVLKNRQILSCTTCKVKKYNYDLVQLFTENTFSYAVCSLNCLPQSSDYIEKLKDTITSSRRSGRQGKTTDKTSESTDNLPVVNSDSGVPFQQNAEVQGYSGSAQENVNAIGSSGTLMDGAQCYQMVTAADGSTQLIPYVPDGQDQNLTGSSASQGTETLESYEVYEEGENEDYAWDGILRHSDVSNILEVVPPYKEMKSKFTMAKPRTKNADTQTDSSAICDMERVPLKTVEKIICVPVPIPFPVYIPSPVFLWEAPVPYPLPIPLPVPIPIPVVFDSNGVLRDSDRFASLFKNAELPKINGIAPMETSHNSSESEIIEIEPDEAPGQHSSLMNGGVEMDKMSTVEMMDCTSPNDGVVSISPDLQVDSCVSLNNPAPIQNDCSISSPRAASNHLQTVSNSVSRPSCTNEAVSSPGGGRKKLTRIEYGLRAWKTSFGPTSDPLNYSCAELASKLAEWVKKGTKPNGERYRADIILYLCLGVQQHLQDNNRRDSIFYDATYQPFVEAITNYAESDSALGINTRIEDNHFWESKQLGSSSPGVLLFTLVYFIYKNFNLKTWEKLASLHFDQIHIEKKQSDGIYATAPKIMTITNLQECEGIEVLEKLNDRERCAIFYLDLYRTKCVSTEGPLFKAINPEFQSGNWFTSESIDQMQLYRMLIRAMMIRTDADSR